MSAAHPLPMNRSSNNGRNRGPEDCVVFAVNAARPAAAGAIAGVRRDMSGEREREAGSGKREAGSGADGGMSARGGIRQRKLAGCTVGVQRRVMSGASGGNLPAVVRV